MKKLLVVTLLLAAVPSWGQEEIKREHPRKMKIHVESLQDGKRKVWNKEFEMDSDMDSLIQRFRINGDSIVAEALKFGEGFKWNEGIPFKKEWERMRLSEPFKNIRMLGGVGLDGFGNVSVYTNIPDTQVLNIRFKTEKAGSVNVAIVNKEGERVAKEVIKDFAGGEYIGQLKLKNKLKGTHFVILSQDDRTVASRLIIEE